MTTIVFLNIILNAIAIAVLLRIAMTDFKKEKITNRDVLILGVVGTGSLAIASFETGFWVSGLGVSLIAVIVLFVLLFPFWLLRKVGAGDVKLMAVAPLVAGGENLLTFSILLLALSIVTVFAVRNPMLLPAPVFRQYLEHFERKGIVPFGVPISGALIGIIVAKALNLATP